VKRKTKQGQAPPEWELQEERSERAPGASAEDGKIDEQRKRARQWKWKREPESNTGRRELLDG